MKLLRKVWADEAGFIISAELVLVATILVIGLIVGMVSLRNQVVEELVDVALHCVSSRPTAFRYAVREARMAVTEGSASLTMSLTLPPRTRP